MKHQPDPLLRVQPWRVLAVFHPLERVLARLEIDGTIETAGSQVVFKEDMRGGWYDMVAAIRGVVQFHELAAERCGLPIDCSALTRFANKLESAMPLFEQDVEAVRKCINACYAQAYKMRISQAVALLKVVQISAALDDIKDERKAA